MLADPETLPPPSFARARVLPTWTLWVAIDDDGSAWAFEDKPKWSTSMLEWMPARGRVVSLAVELDRRALEVDRMPDADGNGRLYLIARPESEYLQPERKRGAVVVAFKPQPSLVGRLALLAFLALVIAIGARYLRT